MTPPLPEGIERLLVIIEANNRHLDCMDREVSRAVLSLRREIAAALAGKDIAHLQSGADMWREAARVANQVSGAGYVVQYAIERAITFENSLREAKACWRLLLR